MKLHCVAVMIILLLYPEPIKSNLKNNHEKEYIVRVNRNVSSYFLKQMAAGVPILDTVTLPCKVEKIDDFTFNIVLTQGLNRQIRRMCEYLNYEVKTLKRIRIMNIKLDVPTGEYRELTEDEFQELNKLISQSTKTFQPNKKMPRSQNRR